jgi:hypothetical protein
MDTLSHPFESLPIIFKTLYIANGLRPVLNEVLSIFSASTLRHVHRIVITFSFPTKTKVTTAAELLAPSAIRTFSYVLIIPESLEAVELRIRLPMKFPDETYMWSSEKSWQDLATLLNDSIKSRRWDTPFAIDLEVPMPVFYEIGGVLVDYRNFSAFCRNYPKIRNLLITPHGAFAESPDTPDSFAKGIDWSHIDSVSISGYGVLAVWHIADSLHLRSLQLDDLQLDEELLQTYVNAKGRLPDMTHLEVLSIASSDTPDIVCFLEHLQAPRLRTIQLESDLEHLDDIIKNILLLYKAGNNHMKEITLGIFDDFTGLASEKAIKKGLHKIFDLGIQLRIKVFVWLDTRLHSVRDDGSCVIAGVPEILRPWLSHLSITVNSSQPVPKRRLTRLPFPLLHCITLDLYSYIDNATALHWLLDGLDIQQVDTLDICLSPSSSARYRAGLLRPLLNLLPYFYNLQSVTLKRRDKYAYIYDADNVMPVSQMDDFVDLEKAFRKLGVDLTIESYD